MERGRKGAKGDQLGLPPSRWKTPKKVNVDEATLQEKVNFEEAIKLNHNTVGFQVRPRKKGKFWPEKDLSTDTEESYRKRQD